LVTQHILTVCIQYAVIVAFKNYSCDSIVLPMQTTVMSNVARQTKPAVITVLELNLHKLVPNSGN